MFKKLLLLVVISSVYLFAFRVTLAYEKETIVFEDSFSTLDSSIWQVYSIDNNVVADGDLILTSENSQYFPFLYTKNNIIPTVGDYFLEVNYYFPETTDWGIGFGIGNSVPNYNITTQSIVDSDFIQFQLWQGKNDGHLLQTNRCTELSVCDSHRTTIFQEPYSSLEHTLRIEYRGNDFLVFKDGVEISNNSLLSVNRRSTIFWIGNNIKLSSNHDWTDLIIKNVKVGKIEELPDIRPVIIIPGLGASWDMGAIMSGTDGTNWRIPSFVKIYDGLINSFVNAGYILENPNKNLFVFAYDWRKPLSILADRLKTFIEANIPAGEKVNLVGHSMGGLVARAYAQENGIDRLNKIITVGSPNMGTVKAYGVWEGATVWDDIWWGKTALDLTTHFGSLPGESAVQTVQRLAPSFKDLLPTYDFLKRDDVFQPWIGLTQINGYLNYLNLNASPSSLLTTAIYSNDIQTDNFINVSPPSAEDLLDQLWVDGKPIDNPFEFANGDGTVTETSAKGPFLNNLQESGWHGELVTKTDNIQNIFSVLGVDTTKALSGTDDSIRNALVVALRSPGNLGVCNFGLTSCNSDIGLYFPEQKLFIFPDYQDEDLMVRVTENGLGDYSLHLGDIGTSSSWTVVGGRLENTDQIDYYNIEDDGQNLTLVLDNNGPTIPQITGFHSPELPCGGSTNQHAATVDWTDSFDKNGVDVYEYTVDYPLGTGREVLDDFISDSFYSLALNEGVHYIKVRARDRLGNLSDWSDTCSITADWTAPIVSISSPVSGTYQPDQLPSLAYSAVDNLDTNLDLIVGDMPKSDGEHTVTVTATDNAGNFGFDSVTYTIQSPSGNIDQCKKFGWRLLSLFNFRNQGECVKYYKGLEKPNGSFFNIFFWW